MSTTAQVISKENLVKHWQGHRALTRRVIEAFPEKEFFEFILFCIDDSVLRIEISSSFVVLALFVDSWLLMGVL